MLTGVYVSTNDLIEIGSYPAPSSRRRRGFGQHSGILSSRLRGRGVDLDEVRLYQPGDDARTIDWKVTARKSKTHTKVFREEREHPTLVVVDQTKSMFFGSRQRMKSVAAAESAARVGWVTLQSRDRIGGLVLGNSETKFFKPIRSKLNLVRFLDALSEQNQNLHRDLHRENNVSHIWEDVLTNIRRIAPMGHRITFISDFQDLEESQLHQLLVLQNHNQLDLLLIYDPLEGELPPAGNYAVTDGRNKVAFSSGSEKVRNQFHDSFEERVHNLEQLCHQRGIRFSKQSTDEDIPDSVIHG